MLMLMQGGRGRGGGAGTPRKAETPVARPETDGGRRQTASRRHPQVSPAPVWALAARGSHWALGNTAVLYTALAAGSASASASAQQVTGGEGEGEG